MHYVYTTDELKCKSWSKQSLHDISTSVLTPFQIVQDVWNKCRQQGRKSKQPMQMQPEPGRYHPPQNSNSMNSLNACVIIAQESMMCREFWNLVPRGFSSGLCACSANHSDFELGLRGSRSAWIGQLCTATMSQWLPFFGISNFLC